MVHGRPVADGAVVREHERLAVVLAVVRQVCARIGGDSGESPRIGAHQLGVSIHVNGDRLRHTRIGDAQAEQRRSMRVGSEVSPLESQPRSTRQRVARISPPAEELRRRSEPRVVDSEPHAVDQLHRRCPYAAHLAADVPAVGVEPSVLEPLGVRSLSSSYLSPVLKPIAGRQFGRGCLRRRAAAQDGRHS